MLWYQLCKVDIKMDVKQLLLLLLVLLVSSVHLGVTSCPNSTATDGTKPLYLLTLAAMYPLAEKISSLAAEIAQEEINNRSDILPGYRIELIKDTIEICSSIEAGIGLSNWSSTQ